MFVPLSIAVIVFMQYRLYPILMQVIFFLAHLVEYLLQDGTECPFVAILLLFLVLAIACCGQTTHYIKPTPDTTCPAEPCLILSEYVQQYSQYLTSNTTLLLLSGIHVLNINFIMENISSFEICNYIQLLSNKNNHPNSTVVC